MHTLYGISKGNLTELPLPQVGKPGWVGRQPSRGRSLHTPYAVPSLPWNRPHNPLGSLILHRLVCGPWERYTDFCWLSILYIVMHAQSCPNLCDPTNCSPLDSSVHENFQARMLQWVAWGGSYSRALHDQRTEPSSPASPAWAGRFFTTMPSAVCILIPKS